MRGTHPVTQPNHPRMYKSSMNNFPIAYEIQPSVHPSSLPIPLSRLSLPSFDSPSPSPQLPLSPFHSTSFPLSSLFSSPLSPYLFLSLPLSPSLSLSVCSLTLPLCRSPCWSLLFPRAYPSLSLSRESPVTPHCAAVHCVPRQAKCDLISNTHLLHVLRMSTILLPGRRIGDADTHLSCVIFCHLISSCLTAPLPVLLSLPACVLPGWHSLSAR